MGGYSRFHDLLSLILLKLEWMGGSLKSEEYYSYGPFEEKVYWISDESDHAFLGKSLMNGRLVMNEARIEDLSDDIADYVFLHELGHTSINMFWRFGFYPLIIFGYIGSFIGIIGIPLVPLILMAETGSVVAAITSLLMIFPLPVSFLIFSAMVSWIDEGHAEIFAFRHLGPERSEKVIRELSEARENEQRGVWRKAWHLFRYPPRSLIMNYLEWDY